MGFGTEKLCSNLALPLCTCMISAKLFHFSGGHSFQAYQTGRVLPTSEDGRVGKCHCES